MEIGQLLQNEIDKIYGKEYGLKTGRVLIPAFLGDFRKVLQKGNVGSVLSEEYMTEDKKMHMIFKGVRRLGAMGYEMVVTSCTCNGRELLTKEVSLIQIQNIE